MLRHYVTFLFPGTFFSESTERKVKDRIPAHVGEIPKAVFALYFWDRKEVRIGREILTGGCKDRSKTIYFGEKFTVSELEERGMGRILIENVRGNGYKYGVKCITGNWQSANDELVLPSYSELRKLTEEV